jgi:hypothetical protein
LAKRGASDGDLMFGALDTICCMHESRGFQRKYSFEEIRLQWEKNGSYQRDWVLKVLDSLEKREQPSFDEMTGLDKISNIGLEKAVYCIILNRLDITMKMFEEHNYMF